MTAHSMFGIPVEEGVARLQSRLNSNSERAGLLRHADVIIWDEAPMSDGKTISSADRLMQQEIMQNSHHFGGVLTIFAGDFRQIPCIVPGGGLGDIIRSSIKQLPMWQTVKHLRLTKPRRALDPEFADWLLTVGDGTAETVQLGEDPVRVIPLPNISVTPDVDKLADFVYPPDILSNPDECAKRAILSGTNRNTTQINNLILSRLQGELIELHSVDSLVDDVEHMAADPTFLSTLNASGVPEALISLKVGSVVILIKNLSFEDRLVNGTKLIVTQATQLLLVCRRPDSDEVVFLPRCPFKFKNGTQGMEISRVQFPIRVAYALTINRSQGQTIDVVGIDLRADVFQHGQLYVAVGRVRARHRLKILLGRHRIVDRGDDGDDENAEGFAYNIVYQQLL